MGQIAFIYLKCLSCLFELDHATPHEPYQIEGFISGVARGPSSPGGTQLEGGICGYLKIKAISENHPISFEGGNQGGTNIFLFSIHN